MEPDCITSTLSVEDSPLMAEKATVRTRESSTAGRSLHLIDADNVIGDPRTTDRRTIAAAFDAYRLAADYQLGDHVIIATGCNGLHVLEVELAWPGVQHRRRSGPDGADLELLEAADFAASSGRYDRVVIGSGDRIFMVAIANLRARSIDVDVVARYGHLAKAMKLQAGGRVRYIDSRVARPFGDEPHAA